jgi:hypothetical protein
MNARIAETPGKVFNAPQCVQRALQISSDASATSTAETSAIGTVRTTNAAYVARDVGLLSLHLNDQTAVAIRACDLMRDNREALFITWHLNVSMRRC